MAEALIYCRFSKADQIRGHSIDRQLSNAREVCAARKLLIIPTLTFVEKGRSAFSGANRARGSLLANLELEIQAGAHRGRTLVVEHLDRISRQGWQEVLDFLRSCSTHGVNVATYDGSRFYEAGDSVSMVEVIEIILKSELSYEESAKKSLRIRKSFAAKREEAKTGGAKRIASRPPSWIKRVPGGFELIDEHADIVREAHRLCQLGHGTAMIAKIFNERGLKPWRATSNGWHESYIGRMLMMRTSIGEYVSANHGTRILDYYPAVITVEEYNRTQAAIQKRANPAMRGRRGIAQTNLFTGIARCAHCSGPMTYKPGPKAGTRAGSRDHAVNTTRNYLKCQNNTRRLLNDEGERVCTNGVGARYERLEPAILDKIMTIALDNDRYNASEISQSRIAFAEAERQLAHHLGELENIKQNLKIRVSPTLMGMLADLEDTIIEAIAERDRLGKELTREASSQPSSEFLARIKATRDAMLDVDLDTRRDARTMVADSLKEVITDMRCDRDGNTVVTIAEGLAAFRVNGIGVVDWQYDGSGDATVLKVLTTEAYASNAERVGSVIDRATRAAQD